ncbi:pesticin C-terminus-like muramidase, partial [Vibrio lentus]
MKRLKQQYRNRIKYQCQYLWDLYPSVRSGTHKHFSTKQEKSYYFLHLGPVGADCDFGQATESAIKQFQKVYEPTHTTHENYQFGEVDGIVSKNTTLALDEAVNENWKYIDAINHENCDCKLSIDHEFIGLLEGSKKNGYVPMPEKSNSGVTIAVGFDLGARNIDDLRRLGLSTELIERF